jgi:hypothetical protein
VKNLQKSSLLNLSCILALMSAPVFAQTTQTRQIRSSGTGYFAATPAGSLNVGGPELDPGITSAANHDNGNTASGKVSINRTMPHHSDRGEVEMHDKHEQNSNPGLDLSVDGLNFHSQRFADHGNQFSIEPPDQGLCAGNGYVLESTNDVLTVFNTSGNPLTGTISLNKFYGYPSAINRSTGASGPSITDPSCYFDQDTQRWFHVVLTLDRVGTGPQLSGKNHLDLAVSQSSDPLGNWTLYRIPVQDDGTDGTPNHSCPGGPCLGDYPHIGADKNGIYLTTNEFPLFANGYIGSQIYAMSKQALASGSNNINLVQYNTADPSTMNATGLPGFTVWPAISSGESPSELHGTEYFLSSLAIYQNSGVDSRLQLWSLTNTKALRDGGTPTLTSSIVNTEPYGIPGLARQPGMGTDGIGQAPDGGNVDFPLGQCFNDPTCATKHVLGFPDPYTETISPLAGNDSRMQQVFYADGKLWSSLGTGIGFTSTSSGDGLAYFVLVPKASGGTPTATVHLQGYLADPNLDMTYGTVAVTGKGKGIISFTATGPKNYPSVGFASLDDKLGVGPVQIVAAGVGANDGFSGYLIEGGNPRWGDYGAAAVDGKSIWFSQEYIGQSCTLSQYMSSTPFGTCSATRGAYGNWGTRIAKVTLGESDNSDD